MMTVKRKTEAKAIDALVEGPDPDSGAHHYPTDTGSCILLNASPQYAIGASVDIHDMITRVALLPEERKHKGSPLKPLEVRVVTHVYEDNDQETILVWEDNSGYSYNLSPDRRTNVGEVSAEDMADAIIQSKEE